MSPLVIAAVMVAGGIVAGTLLPRLRAPRLAVIVPLGGAALALSAPSASNRVPLAGLGSLAGLDSAGRGLLVVAGVSLALVFALQPRLDGTEARVAGVVVGMTALCLASDDTLVTGLALLAAVAALGLRWVTKAPGRITLSAGRVAGGGAGALLAASPFLPLSGFTTGSRPVLVGALLGVAVAALLALQPLGGWATGAFATLPGADVAPWLIYLAPAVLLLAERIPGGALGVGGPIFERLLLVMGLASALWYGLHAVHGADRGRYGRVFMADVALAAASVSASPGSPALTGALILVLTHLSLAPILLRPSDAGAGRPRRAAWALLVGVPPAPSFWGRFLLVEALAATSVAAMLVALAAMAGIFAGAMIACVQRSPVAPSPAWRQLPAEAVGWALVCAAVGLGLAPQAVATLVFGAS